MKLTHHFLLAKIEDLRYTTAMHTVTEPAPDTRSPLSFKIIVAAVTFAFIALLATIVNVLSLKQAPPNKPLEEKATTTQTKSGSCLALSGEDLQDCCEKELIESGNMKAQCIGKWQISNNQCSWVCSE